MYELVLRTQFSAAHQLRAYHGKCEQLHGHNWDVEVVLTASPNRSKSDKLPASGMVIDFVEARKIINRTIEKLDHKYLNELPSFRKVNPTTEHLAKFIFDDLESRFSRRGITIKRAGVWESSRAGAYYSADS